MEENNNSDNPTLDKWVQLLDQFERKPFDEQIYETMDDIMEYSPFSEKKKLFNTILDEIRVSIVMYDTYSLEGILEKIQFDYNYFLYDNRLYDFVNNNRQAISNIYRDYIENDMIGIPKTFETLLSDLYCALVYKAIEKVFTTIFGELM